MTYVDLDKIINVSGGGGSGTIYPDVPYPVLNQRIGIFNAPDARDTDSNGWFGLLGNSNAGICQQNYNFNQQIALAVDSGVGALSTRIKSYDFSVDIDKIDSGAIKFGIFSNTIAQDYTSFPELVGPYSLVTFDEVDKEIDAHVGKNTWTTNWDSGLNNKSYIAVSGGNRYLILVEGASVKSFAVDADDIPTSTTEIDSEVMTGSSAGIVCVKDNYIWAIVGSYSGSRYNQADVSIRAKLISVASDGQLTMVGTEIILEQYQVGLGIGLVGTDALAFSSYTIDNVCYFVAHGIWHANFISGGAPLLLMAYTYNSIDLMNTSAFTNTEIYHTNSYIDPVAVPAGMYDGKGQLNGYYNVSDSKYYYVVGTDIFTVDAGGIVDTTDNAYINGIYRQRYNLGVDMGVEADNISLEGGTGINVKGTSLGGTLTDLYKKCINIYELTGSNDTDNAYLSTYIECISNITPIAQELITPTCEINGVSVPVPVCELFPAVDGNTINTVPTLALTHINTITLNQLIISNASIDIELSFANTLGRDLKLGIGITGGTYTTPTLPSNNGMSAGNATTARTAGSDASYIDLTLST